VQRLNSHNVSGRDDVFRDGIRARDGKCVISGVVNTRVYRDSWVGFEAAHIFPLEKENLWIQYNYGRYITDMDNTTGVSKINSLQNGFVLREDIHSLFDQYLISVNPDVSIRVNLFLILIQNRITTKSWRLMTIPWTWTVKLSISSVVIL
jgi:hypothetical protein